MAVQYSRRVHIADPVSAYVTVPEAVNLTVANCDNTHDKQTD